MRFQVSIFVLILKFSLGYQESLRNLYKLPAGTGRKISDSLLFEHENYQFYRGEITGDWQIPITDQDLNFIAQKINNQTKTLDQNLRARSGFKKFNLNKYNNLKEITSWLNFLKKTEKLVKITHLKPKTFENRRIKLVTILPKNPVFKNLYFGQNRKKKNGKSARRVSKVAINKAIFVECGIHAREWISHNFCQHLIDYLVNSKVKSVFEVEKFLT